MRFGDKLKELRLSKKITQRQLATELNVAPSIYNRFEKNERRVKREMLPKFAAAFAISVDELNKFWIADQVYKLLEFEDNPDDVISIVSEDLNTNDKA